MLLQLKIDFSIPYELTPTLEEINYTLLNHGIIDVLYTETKIKSKRKKNKFTKL